MGEVTLLNIRLIYKEAAKHCETDIKLDKQNTKIVESRNKPQAHMDN